MIALIPIINQLPLPSKRRIDKSRQDIKNVVQNIIDQRKKGLTKSACKGLNISFSFLNLLFLIQLGPDLLDLILMAHGDEKTSKFTDEEIFEEAITFGKYIAWTSFNSDMKYIL